MDTSACHATGMSPAFHASWMIHRAAACIANAPTVNAREDDGERDADDGEGDPPCPSGSVFSKGSGRGVMHDHLTSSIQA
jgi:hypothetical protein